MGGGAEHKLTGRSAPQSQQLVAHCQDPERPASLHPWGSVPKGPVHLSGSEPASEGSIKGRLPLQLSEQEVAERGRGG